MKIPRRQFLHPAAGAAALPAVSRIAQAQAYPTRPITMIVPFPAGGITDTIARVVAERMGRYLRQAVIIENVSGAAGGIGIGRAARAKSDGYVIDLGQADTPVRTRLAELGLEVLPRERQTPEVLGAMVKADAEKWWPVIKELGIKAE